MTNLITMLAGGVNQYLAAMADSDEMLEVEETISNVAATPFWPEWGSFLEMIIRLAINVVTVGIIVHACYYPKVKRRDYYFTFTLIGVSIFLLIYLMGGVKLKIGFALGLFAIFGIIKYRTEQVPIREMTYLFVIIAVAAINGLATSVSYFELIAVNLIFIAALVICENTVWMEHVATKLITYDNPKLAVPDKYEELKADLAKRTGLNIIRVEIGNMDFLKDSVILKIYFKPIQDEFGTIDNVNKSGKKF